MESDITIPEGKWAGFIKVHADGGDCHGTPLREHRGGGHYCPKCGISPDMQSTEFWAPEKVRR
jgi:hypothetical protein